MSFGFRVGPPGFKVRVSNRGVRTSIGPRAARVTFGTGRTRVSSGFGPFFASTTLSGSNRRSTTTRRTAYRTTGPSPTQLLHAERAAERARHDAERDAAIAGLNELRRRSTTVHLQNFPSAQRPVINPPNPVPFDWAEAQAAAYHLHGLSLFARAERKTAKERARWDAQRYVDDETHRLDAVYRDLRNGAELWWSDLCANDELTVCEAVNTAFSDNPAAGCAVGVSGCTLSIVMRQQDIDSLPAQTPGITSAGRPTLKTLTKRDRVTWWLTIMASNLVATAKEAFAVAPGINCVSIAVLSRMPDTMRLGVVAFGTWDRAAIEATPWRTAEDAFRMFDVGRDVACSVRTTASGSLSTSVKPLNVAAIPSLVRLLEDNAQDAGLDTLGELDSALAANQAHPGQIGEAAHPYAVTAFVTWLSQRDQAPPHSPTPPSPPAPAHQQLVAGQTIALPEHATYAAQVALSYRVRIQDADADLALILLEGSGKVSSDDDFIFYNQPATADHSIRLEPKRIDAATVTEHAQVHLSILPLRVTKVLVTLSMDTDEGLDCGAIDSVSLSITSGSQGWVFQPAPDPAIKAMIVAEFYRKRGADGEAIWKLRAVGQGWANGLGELARTYGINID